VLGLRAAANPTGLPDGDTPAIYFVFAGLAAMAAAFDLRMILRGGIAGARRVARHLWRMCFALFVASGSLFLGQPQVFPAPLRGSPLLIGLAVAPLVVMVFWMLKVRFTRAYKPDKRAAPKPAVGAVEQAA
jgi:hypothetical protein